MQFEVLNQYRSNSSALVQLLSARAELAKRAGCDGFAQYITRARMAGSTEVGCCGWSDGVIA